MPGRSPRGPGQRSDRSGPTPLRNGVLVAIAVLALTVLLIIVAFSGSTTGTPPPSSTPAASSGQG